MPNPELQNALYCGTIRYGKSVCVQTKIEPEMLEPKRTKAYIVVDPAGKLTQDISKTLAMAGVDHMYDQVAATSRVPGYGVGRISTNPDPDQREAENRQMMSDVIALLLRSEGKLDATKNKMILQGLTDALQLYVDQKTPVPFYLLRDCFDSETDNAQFLLGNCSNPNTVLRMQYYHNLKAQQREYEAGPARRRLIEACGCVQLRKRCQPTFDFVEFINNKGILLMDGSSTGNLSRQDCTLIMSLVVLLVIALSRADLIGPVVIVIDEGVNSDLIDGNVKRACAELGKKGLEFHLVTQDPLSVADLFQFCGICFLFHMTSPDSALFCARMIGMATYDPLKTKEVIEKIRKDYVGVKTTPITHKSKTQDKHGDTISETTSVSHYTESEYDDVRETINVRYSVDEQDRLWARTLMNLGVGQCIIRNANAIVEGDIDLPPKHPLADFPYTLEPRVTLAEYRFQEHLNRLKTTSAYQTPIFQQCQPKKRQTGME